MSLREAVPATLVDTFTHALETWQRRMRERRAWRAAYDRTVSELSTYTDRELVELGISRADVHDLARQQADRTTGRR